MSPAEDLTTRSIVAAARTLLAEVGAAFTMEQLEARSRHSRATIYRRIGSKQALLERLARERGEVLEPLEPRRRMLQAARAVIARHGLANATMEQIAAEAGIGVATLYRHFGDKESLLHAFMEEMTPLTKVRTLSVHPSDDVVADLEQIVAAMLTFFYQNRDLWRMVFLGGERERRYLERLRSRSDSTLGRLTDYFRQQQAAGRLATAADPAELALALLGMVLAFAVIGPLHYDTRLEQPQRSSRRIVELFVQSLVPTDPPANAPATHTFGGERP